MNLNCIFDSPRSRRVWINQLEGTFIQVMENILLITYELQKESPDAGLLSHWKSELYKQCKIICLKKIDNNSVTHRARVIMAAVREYDIEDLEWVRSYIDGDPKLDHTEGIKVATLTDSFYLRYLKSLRTLYRFLAIGNTSDLWEHIINYEF